MTDGERKDSAAAAALSVEVPATSDEGGFAVGGGSRPSDERPASGFASNRSSGARGRLVAGVVAAASALVIGVSAWALFGGSPTSSDWSEALQTTAEVEGVSGSSVDADADGGDADEGAAIAEEPSGIGADEVGDPASAGAASADRGSDAAASLPGGGRSPSSPGSGASSSDSGTGSDAAGGGAAEPAASVTVNISVESGSVGSPVSYSGTLSFEEGATVYDALCGTGLALATQWNPLLGSLYVSSIGGLAEKHADHPGSGWKYFVNGAEPGYGCNAYVLSDGDSIVWKYVLSSGEGL